MVEYPEGPYPGDEAIESDMWNASLSAFEPFVGRDYESFALDCIFLWPYGEAWNPGYRFGECLVFDMEGTPLVGSACQSGW